MKTAKSNQNAKWVTITGYLNKMKGGKRSSQPVPPLGIDIITAWIGAFVGISVVAILSLVYRMPLMVASLGASAVLIYGVHDAHLAQPRNVIGGHVISAAIGVLVYALFGLTWWSAALATAMAIATMLATHTTHPPGGATALVAVLSKSSLIYVFAPVALGAAILVLVGLVINNLSPNGRYPRYWI